MSRLQPRFDNGLMTATELRNLSVFPEPHKGTHAGPGDRVAAPDSGRYRIVDLSHPIRDVLLHTGGDAAWGGAGYATDGPPT
jgi:hypothetical protein